MQKSVQTILLAAMIFVPISGDCHASEVVGIVSRGSLVIGGNVVTPPYEFRISNDTLIVNGLLVVPPVARPTSHQTMDMPTKKDRLYEEVFAEVDSLLKAGYSMARIRSRAAAKFKKSPLVTSASVSGNQLIVQFKNITSPEYVHLHRPSGTSRLAPPNHVYPRAPLAEARSKRTRELRGHAQALSKMLNMGAMIFIGGDYSYSVPAIKVTAILEELALVRAGRRERGKLPAPVVRDAIYPQPLDSLRLR